MIDYILESLPKTLRLVKLALRKIRQLVSYHCKIKARTYSALQSYSVDISVVEFQNILYKSITCLSHDDFSINFKYIMVKYVLIFSFLH